MKNIVKVYYNNNNSKQILKYKNNITKYKWMWKHDKMFSNTLRQYVEGDYKIHSSNIKGETKI